MATAKNTFKNSGFTLVELLIVVAVIAIISGVGLTSLTRANQSARDTDRRSDIEAIRGALEEYYGSANHNAYPANLNQLETGGFMSDVPEDPTSGSGYNYTVTGGGQSYCLGATLETGPDDNFAKACTPPGGNDYEKGPTN